MGVTTAIQCYTGFGYSLVASRSFNFESVAVVSMLEGIYLQFFVASVLTPSFYLNCKIVYNCITAEGVSANC